MPKPTVDKNKATIQLIKSVINMASRAGKLFPLIPQEIAKETIQVTQAPLSTIPLYCFLFPAAQAKKCYKRQYYVMNDTVHTYGANSNRIQSIYNLLLAKGGFLAVLCSWHIA